MIDHLSTSRIVWGADQTTVLTFAKFPDSSVEVLRLDQPDQRTRVILTPLQRLAQSFQVISASPDGLYLVGCELGPNLLLVYDIVQDRWTPLEQSVDLCGSVLGWVSAP